MQRKLFLLSALLTFYTLSALAQQWGYVTLIAPQNATTASLIDTNGTVVKQWTGLTAQTAYSSYLTKGGDLWRAVKATSTQFNGGGIAGRVQKVNYNGTVLFDYTVSTANECSHHDICPMPNGDVLMIVYEKKTATEVQDAGGSVNAVRWSEKIIQVHPTGTNTATIVWEWHLWDHLVQNVYSTKANYQTSIVDHPELLNINYKNNATDWVHMNGIDYNATLDQIVVSSHNLNELWVIDHSTTTAEAAGHTGGNSGKGGDFLYRWGNPAAYSATGTAVFNVVHDAHWVPEGCPRAGWLGGFNNKGVSSSISAVDLFQPPWDGTTYTHTAGQAYTPATYDYRHQANGFSSNMGNSQQLPNGNMLICLATASKVYEIDANGNQLWQYTSNGSIPQASRYSRCFLENPQVTLVTANPTVCAGGSFQLDITPSATATNGFSYAWEPAAGLSNTTVQDPTISGLSGNATFTVTVTTAGGCTATAEIPVNVVNGVAANAGNDITINLGQAATLTASGGGTYAWSNGSTTPSITVAPSVTTTYTVTVTSPSGCSATDQVIVTVVNPNQVSVAVSATDTVICIGDVIQLFASALGGAGTYTYAWSASDGGFTSTLADPYVNPEVTTTYTVTVSDGPTTATASIEIIVNPLPTQPSVTQFNNTLTSSAGSNNQWFYYGSPIPDANQPTYDPTQEGSYQVQTVDANGCYSPLSDPFEFIFTGTEQVLNENSWTIAPNPADQTITLLGNFSENDLTVEIWSYTGALQVRATGTRTIPVADYPTGTYLLRLITPDGTGVRKVAILH